MKQTILSNRQSPLLAHAISKLRPEVFSHPVWLRFGSKDKTIPPETIQNLFCEAELIQRDNPSEACQILLICAVYQNYSGEGPKALATIQRALDLAECTGLSQEMLWTMWGAGAICVQQENYEQAAIYFGHLQAMLNDENEWMLADYIDVVRQFFLVSAPSGKEKTHNPSQGQRCGYLITSTLDWIYSWGFSARSEPRMLIPEQVSHVHPQKLIIRPLFSEQRPQGPWQALKLIIRGKLNLRGAENDLPPYASNQSSYWDSVLNSLRVYVPGRKIDDATIDTVPERPSSSTKEKAINDFLPGLSTPEYEARSRQKTVNGNSLSVQVSPVIPVSVQMLGRFAMSIREIPLNLPVSRSLSVLKYLMLNHKQNIPREILMDVFWPDAAEETARNNLNVAMYGIRKALSPVIDLPVILYKDGAYSITPALQIWLDVEEFERIVNVGQRLEARNQPAAVSEYETAVSLYRGDFLEENPYEGWTVLTREGLRTAYLNTLDSLSQIYFKQKRYSACITTCQLILARDICREDAHCMLMRCYSRQGQDPLALRQYQACVNALRSELDVAPAPTTTQLYQQIRQHGRV